MVEEEEELASLPARAVGTALSVLICSFKVTHIPASEAEINSREQLCPERHRVPEEPEARARHQRN